MEYKLLKNISVKLDDTYLMILSYMYHSDKETKKSEYRFEIVIDTISNFTEIKNTYINNPVSKWYWFDNLDIQIIYNNLSTNRKAASWLDKRIKSALTWGEFQKEISEPWRNNGWISEGYFNSEIDNLDLKQTTPEYLINLSDKTLRFISDKALSIKQKFI